jgi:hypothetical protein
MQPLLTTLLRAIFAHPDDRSVRAHRAGGGSAVPRSAVLLAPALCALVACGAGESTSGAGGTSGGATLEVTGTYAFGAGNATWSAGSATCSDAGQPIGLAWAALTASDQPGICGYLQRDEDRAGARSITVQLLRRDASGAASAIGAGRYPVVLDPSGEASFALVSVNQADAACHASSIDATTGAVDVTAVASGRLQGTVVANLWDGGQVIGSFDAETCALPSPADACGGDLGLANPACAP